MSSTNQLRVGLIGCGYQGEWLARAAAEVETFQLVAYTDPSDEAAAAVAAIAGQAQRTSSAELLVERGDVDVVFIATPHHLLQPYALQAVAADKHVLAEKPMALNAAQAIELERPLLKAASPLWLVTPSVISRR
jgi:predicted dehydrogenase